MAVSAAHEKGTGLDPNVSILILLETLSLKDNTNAMNHLTNF